MYFKGFDEKLCGHGNFQFEVGKEYDTQTENTWNWFHYTAYIAATLIYFEASIRVCEVEPRGDISCFKDPLDGYGKGYFTTNRIYIKRELSREEMFDILIEEQCPFSLLLNLEPPLKILMQYKSSIKGSANCLEIIQRDDLTVAERKELLPKKWHKMLDRYEMMR